MNTSSKFETNMDVNYTRFCVVQWYVAGSKKFPKSYPLNRSKIRKDNTWDQKT